MSASDLTVLAFVSPAPVAVLCILYFVFAADRLGTGHKGVTRRFVGRFLLWTAVGLGSALVIAFAWGAVGDAMAGLVFLVLFGPVAISVGMIVGTIRWQMRERRALASS